MKKRDRQRQKSHSTPTMGPDPARPEDTAEIEGSISQGHVSIVCHVHPVPPECYRKDFREDKTPLWKKVLDIATFFVAIAVAVIYFRQLYVMQDQLSTARRTSQIDERAWLKIFLSAKADVTDDNRVTLPITLLNTGRTPARKVSWDVAVESVKNGSDPSFTYEGHFFHTTSSLLYPNETANYSDLMGRPDFVAGLSPEEKADFDAGNSYLVIYSRVTYDDIYNVNHLTTFCNWAGGKKGGSYYTSKACTDYSNVDNNYEK